MSGRILFIILLVLLLPGLSAQPSAGPERSSLNEVTLYFVPAAAKYDWSSPRTLYYSYLKNYWKKIFKSTGYLTGHTFVELRSPMLDEELLVGMRSTDRHEQRDLVFKEHYGLSILGTELYGSLDEPEDLRQKMDKLMKKGYISFIRFYVNDEAFERMLEFREGYNRRLDSLGTPSRCYGGAFWPRFYGEGAGCAAYVMSYLEVAGLMQEEYSSWKVQVNIPMGLIGGPYNPDQEVKMKDIRKCMSWASSGTDGKDYESYWLYDPTLMHEWVLEKYSESTGSSQQDVNAIEIGKAKGVVIDARNIPAPSDDIFIPRTDPSIFIEKQGHLTETRN